MRNHKRPNVGPVLAKMLPRLGACTGPLPKWYLRTVPSFGGSLAYLKCQCTTVPVLRQHWADLNADIVPVTLADFWLPRLVYFWAVFSVPAIRTWVSALLQARLPSFRFLKYLIRRFNIFSVSTLLNFKNWSKKWLNFEKYKIPFLNILYIMKTELQITQFGIYQIKKCSICV